MKKYITPVFFALLIGLILGRFVLNQYTFEGKIVSTFSTGEKLYFIQQGVYSTKENMAESLKDIPYYIYSLEDDKYYVYIGITGMEQNIEKIKGYYEEKGYTTYMKEINVSNKDFITVLNQYDALLKESQESEVVGTICSQVLTKYEELVLQNDN